MLLILSVCILPVSVMLSAITVDVATATGSPLGCNPLVGSIL